MLKQFCQYCGSHINERCNCERELALYENNLVEELENRPETQYGWYQQDLIDYRKMER